MTHDQTLVKHRKGKWVERFHAHILEVQAPTEDDIAWLTQHQALGSRIREAAVACGCGSRMLANIDMIQAQIRRWIKTYSEYLEEHK